VSGGVAFGDQTKATAALLAFYNMMALGPTEASNSQKLDAVAAYLARYIVARVREAHVADGQAALRTNAEETYNVD
jgi:hypothetical protein